MRNSLPNVGSSAGRIFTRVNLFSYGLLKNFAAGSQEKGACVGRPLLAIS
jgi:hypothetical protein